MDYVLAYSCLLRLPQKIWFMGFGLWIWERELWERNLGVGLLLAPCFWRWKTRLLNSQNMVFSEFFLFSFLEFIARICKRILWFGCDTGMPFLVGVAYGSSFIFFAFQHDEMRYRWDKICWQKHVAYFKKETLTREPHIPPLWEYESKSGEKYVPVLYMWVFW